VCKLIVEGMDTRDLLLLIGFLRAGKMFPAAVPQRELPAARSLREAELAAVRERVVLLDHAGNRLGVDQLVGDVPDPGVLMALLHDAAGPQALSPAECRAALAAVAQTDTEIAAKLLRHLNSDDATLMARLDLAG
jgi:hypothetical protein